MVRTLEAKKSSLLRIIHETSTSLSSSSSSLSSSSSSSLRDQSLTNVVGSLTTYSLLREADILDEYCRRSSCPNLYHRVRALLFLHAIHRYHLPEWRRLLGSAATTTMTTDTSTTQKATTFICPKGYAALLDRQFDVAVDYFLESVSNSSSTVPIYDNDSGNDSRKGSASSNVPRRTSLVSLLSYSFIRRLVLMKAMS